MASDQGSSGKPNSGTVLTVVLVALLALLVVGWVMTHQHTGRTHSNVRPGQSSSESVISSR